MILNNNHLNQLIERGISWAPEGVGIAVTDPTLPAYPVWPQEAPAIARAIPARRREFAAGRHAARRAMGLIGVAPRALPGGQNRAPQWPAGLTGSISHDATSCIALVTRTDRFRALGVDVEPDAPLPEDLVPEICVSAERAWLETQPVVSRYMLARKIFCAKEALYKAQFPLTRLLFGFDAVQVFLDPGQDTFTAVFLRTVGPIRAGSRLSGRVGSAGGHVLAMVSLGVQNGSQNADFPVSAIG
ncbi:4'-phosphopantetheinyl transferase family protein [Shimia aestuarii]|uniref:Enterobactin synthase component D n=1 Tax=Shimia aestuarii TaxID=254406 RepID=A0A1I4K0L8_9RHOB|nr:4'-phosphopantetheinyl transferase superfamily protein [Shimia aestuarii]SFL72043.1 4'-phosphopantetheinyl transferase EntD (siderophore biosynthesis) [Shimia aestuarii]